jgi:hypothetical protein
MLQYLGEKSVMLRKILVEQVTVSEQLRETIIYTGTMAANYLGKMINTKLFGVSQQTIILFLYDQN